MLVKQDQNVEDRYLYIELPYFCSKYNIHVQSEIFMSKTAIYVFKLQYLYFHIFARFSQHKYFLRLDIKFRALFLANLLFSITTSCNSLLKCPPSSKTTWWPTSFFNSLLIVIVFQETT